MAAPDTHIPYTHIPYTHIPYTHIPYTHIPYTHIEDLARTVEIPSNGILSRTVFSDAFVSVVVFGFDAGQEMSEHTAARPALLQIVRGEARLTLGGDLVEGRPGTWVHMPANLPHSVHGTTPLVIQLVLLPASHAELPGERHPGSADLKAGQRDREHAR